MNKKALTSFATKVAACISRHGLLPDGAPHAYTVLVALSGGADSVALLRVLMELGYQCEAAHCNFQLRGAESDADQQFATSLCRAQGITLHTQRFDTQGYAAAHHISIEMAARDLRYAYFAKLASERGLQCVAVAHHRDDNAETILLNMVRGTGIRGLRGMAYKRDNIIRPLLDVGRDDIIAYLNDLGQKYVTDSSNLVADVKRNIIRLRLMPILRELNPSVVDTLVSNACHLEEVYRHAQSAGIPAWQESGRGLLTISKNLIADRFVLHELLSAYGFTPSQVADIWQGLDGTAGALFHSATHTLLRDRDTLVLNKKDNISTTTDNHIHINLCESSEVAVDNTRIAFRHSDISEFHSISKDTSTAILDADKVGSRLTVRYVSPGDRFVPFGMQGSKLVSDYMTDRKMNHFEKQQQLVVTNDTDIIWLVGQRSDNRYRVDLCATKRLLIVTVKPET